MASSAHRTSWGRRMCEGKTGFAKTFNSLAGALPAQSAAVKAIRRIRSFLKTRPYSPTLSKSLPQRPGGNAVCLPTNQQSPYPKPSLVQQICSPFSSQMHIY